MSFSKDVKTELAESMSNARHCRLAELSAIISMCGRINVEENGQYRLWIHTENSAVARKCYGLISKIFHVKLDVMVRTNRVMSGVHGYWIVLPSGSISEKIIRACKLMDQDGYMRAELTLCDEVLVQNFCCKRAYIRGAFLASGSISDPKKTYHFEIVCDCEEKANLLRKFFMAFDIDAKVILRKKYYVTYIKDGAMIVDALNVMEAHIALMKLENVRILKDMRNSVNRRVNCETANINKTVSAAVRQIEDITYIRETIGFEGLKEPLKEIALLRLEEPDMPLKELGERLNPPVGKSGVNHRLRKLSIIAKDLRGE